MESDFRTSGFSDALVILGAAGIVIPAFARIRISPIIGFILIGMIVGPAGLGAFADQYRWLSSASFSFFSRWAWSFRSEGCGRCAPWSSARAPPSCFAAGR